MEATAAGKGKNRAHQGATVGQHLGLHLFQVGGIDDRKRHGRTMARIGIQTATKAAVGGIGVLFSPILKAPAKDTAEKLFDLGEIMGRSGGQLEKINGLFLIFHSIDREDTVFVGEIAAQRCHRRRIRPIKVDSVAATLVRSRRSLRTYTPRNKAKRMLVSRSAVTRAMGAWVKAQVTKA